MEIKSVTAFDTVITRETPFASFIAMCRANGRDAFDLAGQVLDMFRDFEADGNNATDNFSEVNFRAYIGSFVTAQEADLLIARAWFPL